MPTCTQQGSRECLPRKQYIWHMSDSQKTDYSKLSTRELYELTAKAEGYESVPVDIDTFLNDPYYLGQTYDEGRAVYPYWREALHKIYPNPLYSPYEEICLSGDTEVMVSVGAGPVIMTMCEIYRTYRGKGFKVFAYNSSTHAWEQAVAHSPAVTGFKPVYKIILNTGASFKATGEHPILGLGCDNAAENSHNDNKCFFHIKELIFRTEKPALKI